MKQGKKLLSLFLAVAIAVSGINFAGALQVDAANDGIMTVTGGSGVVTPLDGASLKNVIDQAEELIDGKNENEYLGYQELADAIADANELYTQIVSPENGTSSVTEKEVQDMIARLQAAMEGFVVSSDDGSLAGDVEKTQLQNAIKTAEDRIKNANKEEYTEESWNALEKAIADAKALLEQIVTPEDGTVKVTKAQVRSAITALNTELVPKTEGSELAGDAEKTQLQNAIKTAEDKIKNANKEEYTEESWNALEKAIADAKALLEQIVTPEDGIVKVTKAQVQNAITELEKGLVLKTPEDAKPTAEDWEALEEQMAIANTKNEADYVEETWNVFATAKNNAQRLLDNREVVSGDGIVTKKQVVDATTALKEAIAGLQTKPGVADKTALQEQIARAERLDAKNFTTESWNAMQAKLQDAKAVNAKTDATQAEVDAAASALKEALDNLKPATGTPAVDKTALQAQITRAEKLVAKNFTTESWNAMQAKLKDAKAVNAKADATQAEVNKAANELKTALDNLKPATSTSTVDKAALQTAINQAKALLKDKAKYTSASWKAFEDALKAAEVVYNDAKATKDQVSAAVTKLNTAKNGLKFAVTSVKINNKSVKIAAGKKVTLSVTVAPKNAANKAVKWSIAKKDQKYAKVNAKGVVTTTKKGAGKKVKVTATAADGSGKKATVTITIMKNSVTKVTLKAKAKKVKAGKSLTIKATVKTNGKKANKTLEWSLDKKAVKGKYATISKKGVLKTKKKAKGKTITVTAKATDGSNKKATIKIKVVK
ncbi:hypothetical protein D3Z36_07940 [Lachnospiraceae bacterium]|nr:hypothetical protein [Lachnospiraceae bacterium]